MANEETSNEEGLQIISPAFREGESIPVQYTCKGEDISPPLNFLNIPGNSASLALIMHDPDAPSGDFVHWVMWDIPTDTESIAASSVPVGAVQGSNSSNDTSYMGPCPPAGTGTHRYMFELYALDTTLSLAAGSSRAELVNAMQGHIIDQHTLTGTFSA